MKIRSMTLITAISFLLSNCGDNKATTNESQLADNSSTEKKENLTTIIPQLQAMELQAPGN